jgi:hypothetical protein
MIDREYLNSLLESRKLHAKDILKKVLKDADEWDAIDSVGVETYQVPDGSEWVADVGVSTSEDEPVRGHEFRKEAEYLGKSLEKLYPKAQITKRFYANDDYQIRMVFPGEAHGDALEIWDMDDDQKYDRKQAREER